MYMNCYELSWAVWRSLAGKWHVYIFTDTYICVYVSRFSSLFLCMYTTSIQATMSCRHTYV